MKHAVLFTVLFHACSGWCAERFALSAACQMLRDGGGWKRYVYVRDVQGNIRAVVGENNAVAEQTDYYPYGMPMADVNSASAQPFKFGGKELEREGGTDFYDFEARRLDFALGRFTSPDPLCEQTPEVSPSAYCAADPVNRVDPDGKEWHYTEYQSYAQIVLEINLSTPEGFTKDQISSYKTAINNQFNDILQNASDRKIFGNILFYDNNPNITQQLSLTKSSNAHISGSTFTMQSSVSICDSNGNLRDLENVALTVIHELLHTLRVEHPFEKTQTEDTELIKIGPNSFETTATTDKNIVNNIMNYSMIIVNGQTPIVQNSLTRGQLDFMIKEIKLQKQGYGFIPAYNQHLSSKQNELLFTKYYENYWIHTPGNPVKSR